MQEPPEWVCRASQKFFTHLRSAASFENRFWLTFLLRKVYRKSGTKKSISFTAILRTLRCRTPRPARGSSGFGAGKLLMRHSRPNRGVFVRYPVPLEPPEDVLPRRESIIVDFSLLRTPLIKSSKVTGSRWVEQLQLTLSVASLKTKEQLSLTVCCTRTPLSRR